MLPFDRFEVHQTAKLAVIEWPGPTSDSQLHYRGVTTNTACYRQGFCASFPMIQYLQETLPQFYKIGQRTLVFAPH
jgi:hypothetical protein